MKSYIVKDVDAVRYFLTCGNSEGAKQGYNKLTEIIARTEALHVSEEMMLEYISQRKEVILFGRFYKKLWSLIGGRPWTYIIRESPRWSALLAAALIGIGLVSLRSPRPVILAIGAGIGFILGHLFW